MALSIKSYRKLLLILCSLLMVLGSDLGSSNSAKAAIPDSLFKFDFGPGAVQAGYTQILQSTAYSQSLGYGFTDPSKVTSRDRGTGDALRSDFLLPAGTPFLVDLPNGDYSVTLISGDAIASSNTDVYAEGSKVATLKGGAGSYAEQTVTVAVNDGQLTLDFVSSVPRINALEISRIYKFDFGPGAVAAGYTAILSTTAYSASLGYGFQDISLVSSRDRGTSDPLTSDFCLPGTPFLVDLPNGIYDVTIVSGDALGKTSMDVRAEGLLELYSYGAPTGNYIQEPFPVKVEDGQLTLDFIGSVPHVNALVVKRRPDSIVDNRITVFLAGDSTVSDYNQYQTPQAGWGQMLPNFFNSQAVAVDNQAKRGRSSKSFYDEGSLDTILSRIKPNDYMLIMFGINDAATDTARHTDPSTTFKDYLTLYINAARQHNAIPILVTSQSKRTYDANGVFYNSIGNYPAAMRELGAAMNVPVIDLNALSIGYYNSVGAEATKNVFLWLDPGVYPNFPDGAQDNVHFQENGATQLARLVTQAIKDQNIQPLAQYVN